MTGMPVAVRCVAVQPIRRVGTGSVGHPQSNSVSAVNDGISMTFESENRKQNHACAVISRAALSVNARGVTKMAKLIELGEGEKHDY